MGVPRRVQEERSQGGSLKTVLESTPAGQGTGPCSRIPESDLQGTKTWTSCSSLCSPEKALRLARWSAVSRRCAESSDSWSAGIRLVANSAQHSHSRCSRRMSRCSMHGIQLLLGWAAPIQHTMQPPLVSPRGSMYQDSLVARSWVTTSDIGALQIRIPSECLRFSGAHTCISVCSLYRPRPAKWPFGPPTLLCSCRFQACSATALTLAAIISRRLFTVKQEFRLQQKFECDRHT